MPIHGPGPTRLRGPASMRYEKEKIEAVICKQVKAATVAVMMTRLSTQNHEAAAVSEAKQHLLHFAIPERLCVL